MVRGLYSSPTEFFLVAQGIFLGVVARAMPCLRKSVVVVCTAPNMPTQRTCDVASTPLIVNFFNFFFFSGRYIPVCMLRHYTINSLLVSVVFEPIK